MDILGWLVVRKVDGDTATAEIRMSRSDIERGDRMGPRIAPPTNIEVKYTPDAIEGNIIFIPEGRAHVAEGDYVYLNRGAASGFALGSEAEVYVPGALRDERVAGKQVMTPDRIVASLVVVEIQLDTAVAYVTGSRSPLEVGDRVRPVPERVAQR